jgi:hypothetical protein
MKANVSLKPAGLSMLAQADASLSRAFFKIVVGSTALGLGFLAAAIEAVGRDVGGFTFQASAGTFVAFALGMAAGLYFWKVAVRSLWAVRAGSALLVLAGFGGFLYPLRFVPNDKMAEIGIGLGFAVCALSCGAFMLWRMKRFFDEDDAAEESNKQ